MEERKISITIDGENREVWAGNAALMRYRKQGGSMSVLEGFDTEGANGVDETLETIESLALLLFANLVEKREGESVETIVNGFASMGDLVEASQELFSGVPWLKNQAAAGSARK